MKKFSLIFENGTEVKYLLYDNELAYSWFNLLENRIYNNDYFIEDTYSGFYNPAKIINIQQNLLVAIDIIKSKKPKTFDNVLFEYIDDIFTQNCLNNLHFIYENIVVDKNYRIDHDLVQAMNDLNIFIHELENAIITQTRKQSDSRIRVRFLKHGDEPFQFEKKNIIDDYNDMFTPLYIAGGIKLNYSQVGKDYIECYRRQDVVTTPRPLETYSASFVADFGPYNNEWHANRVQLIHEWYSNLGYDTTDPKCRLGQVYVAIMFDTSNMIDIITAISENKKLIGII